MAKVVLATINIRYHHAAFGLRYLWANLGQHRECTVIEEFTCAQSVAEIGTKILEHKPELVALGVYIWNTQKSEQLLQWLRVHSPTIKILLGGPEVSHEAELQKLVGLADGVISGEADAVIEEAVSLMLGDEPLPSRITSPLPPNLSELESPYSLYSDEDIAHRTIYVEASRGCPFKCEFCLSSLDSAVRRFDLDLFLGEMENLYQRGARQFKFVDRTFNLRVDVVMKILGFFLERDVSGMFLHFEVVPDRLSPEIVDLIGKFEPGKVQLELGVQTFNKDVAAKISRSQNYDRLEKNILALRHRTNAHLHCDLIVGLPTESLASFGAGFDRLYHLNPQEIQVGVLKRLRGTPIIRYEGPNGLRFDAEPPYEVVQTSALTREEVLELDAFAHLWDKFGNRGYFVCALPLLMDSESPFVRFRAFAIWMATQLDEFHGQALSDLEKLLYRYLTETLMLPRDQVANQFVQDRVRLRTAIPRWLKQASSVDIARYPRGLGGDIPARQARHLAR